MNEMVLALVVDAWCMHQCLYGSKPIALAFPCAHELHLPLLQRCRFVADRAADRPAALPLDLCHPPQISLGSVASIPWRVRRVAMHCRCSRGARVGVAITKSADFLLDSQGAVPPSLEAAGGSIYRRTCRRLPCTAGVLPWDQHDRGAVTKTVAADGVGRMRLGPN